MLIEIYEYIRRNNTNDGLNNNNGGGKILWMSKNMYGSEFFSL